MLRIREILKEKGVAQTELAEILNRKKQQVNDIVSGRVGVSITMLESIAAALDVPVWQLFASPEEVAQCATNEDFIAFVRNRGETFTFDSKNTLIEYADSLKRL